MLTDIDSGMPLYQLLDLTRVIINPNNGMHYNNKKRPQD